MIFRSRCVRRPLEHGAEGQHLAEHACRLGERQRRLRHEQALLGGEHLVHAMPKLVGERHHVARLALVVEQHVRMRRRHCRVGEGARRLAGPRRRVDPAPVEEVRGDRRHLRGEAAIGVEHRLARLRPWYAPVARFRQRRVAVPKLQLLLAEPARLQRVVAMREPRIGGAHRRYQRIDHLRLDPVREMPRRSDVLEAPPLVGDRLVLGEHVGDVGEETEILLERRGKCFGGAPALLLIRVDETVQRRLER